MDAGRLNKRITIQRRGAKDTYGQQDDSWVPVATVWANVLPIGGREKLRADAVASQLTDTVCIRYRADLLPEVAAAMRILYGTRVLNITSARDVEEEHCWIIFDCTEVAENGG